MKKYKNKIPSKIVYVCAPPEYENIGADWDQGEYIDGKFVSNLGQIKLMTAFVADVESDYDLHYKRNDAYRVSRFQSKEGPIKEFLIDNEPIENIKIISISYKKNYLLKIGNFLIESPQDVILDTMIHAGIEKGGVLGGKYIWAKVGAKLSLLRVGSSLYNKIIAVEKDSKKNFIPIDQLEVGGLYKDAKNFKGLYIGKVNSWSSTPDENNVFQFKKVKNQLLFLSISDYDTFDSQIKSIQNGKFDQYKFSLKSKHEFVEKINQINIPNVIDDLRKSEIANTDKYITSLLSKKHTSDQKIMQIISQIYCNSKFLNLSKVGEEMQVPYNRQNEISSLIKKMAEEDDT